MAKLIGISLIPVMFIAVFYDSFSNILIVRALLVSWQAVAERKYEKGVNGTAASSKVASDLDDRIAPSTCVMSSDSDKSGCFENFVTCL
jgi:hypothetical protein